MDKKYALFFAIAVTFFIFLAFSLLSFSNPDSSKQTREKVLISRVIDGDTLKLLDERTVRLVNINAPEKKDYNHEQAFLYLKTFENKSVELESLGTDKYNRVLARIYAPEYVNFELVRLGLSSKFLVQEEEKSKFAEAESYAIKNSLGIWNKSYYYGCFKSSVNPHDEIVDLSNNCGEINIKGWYVKDESRKEYFFGNLTIGKIKLHSLIGEDNSTDLFWNSKESVWNNDADSLFLFDSQGRIAHYEAYGY